MDFTLALTHFCEAHGPKSVLCTQVLPFECALCLPVSPSRSRRSSHASVHHTQINKEKSHNQATIPIRGVTSDTAQLSSQPNPQGEFGLMSPSIEQHPLYRRNDLAKDLDPQFRYGRAQGETCASCSFTVPPAIAAKLPQGAPGSLKGDGKTKNGAPVLRSREFVCLGDKRKRSGYEEPNSSQDSNASSVQSDTSSTSHIDCHDHTLTYLTAKSPDDPQNYAQLRASVIRALSFEVLPRGMSEGPLCFGDSSTGYTIAYVFRLTDPKARGRRRAYAFVALAGKDANRAFKACPMLWEAFAAMSKSIEDAAQRCQEEQEKKDVEGRKEEARNYTPVSAFLTQRPTNPDGQPRRAGQTQPRSLAEIIGDENIFTILHQYFVAVLRCLGDKFGGLPLSEDCSALQSITDEQGADEKVPNNVRTDLVAYVDRNENKTPTPLSVNEDIEVLKTRFNKQMKRKSQCAPLSVDSANNRQVVA